MRSLLKNNHRAQDGAGKQVKFCVVGMNSKKFKKKGGFKLLPQKYRT